MLGLSGSNCRGVTRTFATAGLAKTEVLKFQLVGTSHEGSSGKLAGKVSPGLGGDNVVVC